MRFEIQLTESKKGVTTATGTDFLLVSRVGEHLFHCRLNHLDLRWDQLEREVFQAGRLGVLPCLQLLGYVRLA